MMMHKKLQWVLVLLLFICVGGCGRFAQAIRRIPSHPTVGNPSVNHSHAKLVSYGEPLPPVSENDVSAQAESGSDTVDARSKVPAAPAEGEAAANDVAPVIAYTAPGLPYQHLALAVTTAAVASDTAPSDADDIRRDLVDSLAFSESGPVGRLGLTAPPTQLGGRVTSRPGLQDGPATGLGFAIRDRNIFSAQSNRLTGSGGRCQDLASAGFFGGSRTRCESTLRR